MERRELPVFEFEGQAPKIHPTAFVASTATIIGDVTIEEGASVWYGAVVRADFAPIVIRAGSNVQDGAVLHGPPGLPLEVGPGATVAHLCVIHGATLGEECLIANGAIVLDGARVGDRALVAAGSVVKGGTEIPKEVLAAGAPAEVKGPIAGTQSETWVRYNPAGYRDLAQRYRADVKNVGS